jgi:hypothetical protein
MYELRERVETKLKDKSYIAAFDVAIGHYHDLIYINFTNDISFTTSTGKSITISTVVEPDGICIFVSDTTDYLVYGTVLNQSIYDLIKNDIISNSNVSLIAESLTYLFDLMIEYNMEPEEYFNYG